MASSGASHSIFNWVSFIYIPPGLVLLQRPKWLVGSSGWVGNSVLPRPSKHTGRKMINCQEIKDLKKLRSIVVNDSLAMKLILYKHIKLIEERIKTIPCQILKKTLVFYNRFQKNKHKFVQKVAKVGSIFASLQI